MKNIITRSILLIFVFMFLAVMSEGCSSGKSITSGTSLEGTVWVLETINGKSVAVTSGNNATLMLEASSGKISGNGTCNSFFGSYKSDGSALSFSEIGSTKMMCDEMSVEMDYFAALKKTDKYEIKSGKLQLLGSSAVLLIFRKK